MSKFTKISEDAFDELQLDAGVLLANFDPSNPVEPDSDDIIATTSGGIQVNCTPTYSDFAEDVDNAPANLKEFKHLDSWDCNMQFTSIKFNANNTKWSLGAADRQNGSGFQIIRPRRNVKQSDFSSIWWVGDKANGGAYAVQLLNALSTGGLAIQTSKNAKGTSSVTLTGHVSLANQNTMPMVFYDIEPTTYTITQTLSYVTSNLTETSVVEGEDIEAVLSAETGYTLPDSAVIITVGGSDVTESVYSGGVAMIDSVSGNVSITATAVAKTYTITQDLTHVTSSLEDETATHGTSIEATLTAEDGYTIETPVVLMGNTDITSTAWDSETGKVTIASVTGNVTITATATED